MEKNKVRVGKKKSTSFPDILPLDALVNIKSWQLCIIPGETVQMDTPWMESGKHINTTASGDGKQRRLCLIVVEMGPN